MKDPVLRDKLKPNYCFWCTAYGSDNYQNCIDCGAEIGSYPPEVATLISDHDKQLIASIKESVTELYQPAITNLELDEHQGVDKPVVYLDYVHQILDGMEQKK